MQSKALHRSSLLVVAVLLLAVVSLSQLLFKGWRLDLTENQLYTLSDGTKNILDKIEEPVQLYFFYNREAAADVPHIQSYANRVQEFLDELKQRAGDNLKLTLVAPEPFSTDEDRAVELGVQGIPLNDAGDKLYFGLAGTNAVDDTQTIPFFQPNRESLLEYDVAKMVYSLANPVKPKLGLMSTLDVAGGYNPQTMQPTQPWAAIQQLDEFFQVESIATDATSFADDIQLLVVLHPVGLGEETLYAIDQFVLNGGKALVFVDPFSEAGAPRGGMMDPNDNSPGANSNLEPLMAAWGVKLRGDILGDGGAALQVQTQFDQRGTYHLGMLGYNAERFNSDDVVTQDLESMNFGFAGILEPTAEASTQFEALISSTDKAAPIPSFRVQPNMNPANLLNGFVPTGESYALAARLSGPAKSAYGEAAPATVTNDEHRSEAEDINVVVVADTDFLSDRFWVQVQNFLGQIIATPFASNGDFLLNAVDNLLGSADVIGIKGRAGFSRPFDKIEEMKREADARFRQHEQNLQDKLRETENKLSELQSTNADGNVLMLSPEQQLELEKFQEEQLKTRKELREVRHSLNKDIDSLQAKLKFLNIGLVPLFIILFAVGAGMRRRRLAGA